MIDTTSQVKKQYTKWPYPEPISDIEDWKARGGSSPFDLRMDHVLIFPERAYDPKMSILVAGCGTMEAAIEAYDSPEASVTGIDLSSASLECADKLKKKHHLDNLDLIEMDLQEVASLGRKFDLIVSFGVLHHLEEPHKGLAALTEALEDDGAIFLMLYGKHARSGIYMVQEAFRRMNLGQSASDVSFAGDVLDALPIWHPVHAYFQSLEHRYNQATIVDTFLHKKDLAFSVPDILELAERCHLEFQGWFDNINYYPEGTIDAETEMYSRIASLPEPEQWAIVELLTSRLRDHVFVLRKKKGNSTSIRSQLASRSFLELFPLRHRSLHVNESKQGTVSLDRADHSLALEGFERELFTFSDGATNIGDIIARRKCKVWGAEEKARHFFNLMWRLGHLRFSKVPCLETPTKASSGDIETRLR